MLLNPWFLVNRASVAYSTRVYQMAFAKWSLQNVALCTGYKT